MKYAIAVAMLSLLGACSAIAPKVGQNCINAQPAIYKVQGVSNAETETHDSQCTAAQLAVPG